MATGTSSPKRRAPTTAARKAIFAAALILAVAALWLLFNFAHIKNNARLGTAYAAHVACSCRYIQGRPLKLCYKDFEPGMGMISLTDYPAEKRVTASVPLLARATAERHRGYGCQLLNEKESAARN